MTQGVRALTAFARPVDDALAQAYLTPAQFTLFKQLNRSEQLHSLRVLRAVRTQDAHTPPDLAAAALLHDVGKARFPLRVWQKTLVVLARNFTPALYRRWAHGSPRHFWTRGFVVNRDHPRWGADMVAAAGGSDVLVWLVAHHADDLDKHAAHPHAALLRRLKAADDAN